MEPEQACIVVRSVGERTTAACREILAGELPGAAIVLLEEAPQSVAVRRTFEVGLDAGAPWTVAVDADVLVRPGGVSALLELADAAAPEVFQVQVELLDKAFAVSRTCGLKALRTAWLADAAGFARRIGNNERPDTYVAHEMRSQGHPFVKHRVTLGIHDFAQHYHDLFRKGSLHARKHRNRMGYAYDLWSRLADEDGDYMALLLGARHGRDHGGRSPVDVRATPPDLDARLSEVGLEPKSAPGADELTATWVEEVLAGWSEPAEVRRHRSSGRALRRLVEPVVRRVPEGLRRRLPGGGATRLDDR